MANEEKKVSFQEAPGDEKRLVVFNEGASDGPRQRKRSRAPSKMSMGSETGDEEEKAALDRDDSVVSVMGLSNLLQRFFQCKLKMIFQPIYQTTHPYLCVSPKS